jgi:hypothetical protein
VRSDSEHLEQDKDKEMEAIKSARQNAETKRGWAA